jgi:phospholipase C
VQLPDTGAYAPPDKERHDSYVPKPPAAGALPKQEPGSRPSRPLRYAPYADGAATPATGRFTLTFSAGKSAGAGFYVTSANRTDGPWTYTAEAGKTISDTWNAAYSKGSYDLSVFGPNGFLVTFRGTAATVGPEVTVRHDAGNGGQLVLTATNAATSACRLTVANAYGAQSSSFTVPAGGKVVRTVDVRGGKHWYDLKVTSATDSTFLRRFAGHVETGRPGVSDPALATG